MRNDHNRISDRCSLNTPAEAAPAFGLTGIPVLAGLAGSSRCVTSCARHSHGAARSPCANSEGRARAGQGRVPCPANPGRHSKKRWLIKKKAMAQSSKVDKNDASPSAYGSSSTPRPSTHSTHACAGVCNPLPTRRVSYYTTYIIDLWTCFLLICLTVVVRASFCKRGESMMQGNG